MRSKRSFIHFNAGEWSPKVDARVDHQSYPAACRQLQNMLPMPHGPVSKRKGFEFIAPTKDDTKESRLMRFQFSREITYCIEAGDQYMRFYKDGTQILRNADTVSSATAANPVVCTSTAHGYSNGDEVVMSGFDEMTELNGRRYLVANVTANTFELTDRDGNDIDGTGYTAETTGGESQRVYEISTDYLEDEVKQLQFAQVNDVLFIVHENHPPFKLGRISDLNWTLTEVDFDYPPFLDENIDTGAKLALSAVTGTGVTMTATGHTPFDADHVGSYWRIGHYNTDIVDQGLFNFSGTSASIFITGPFTISTTGTWNGTLILQESDDAAFTTPTDIRSYDSNSDKNYNSELIAKSGGAYYRWKSNATITVSSDTARGRIEPNEAIREAVVKVTAYTSPTVVTVDVIQDALSTDATDLWAEGAFSDVRGHPQAITFYENRIVYANTAYQPQTFWGSSTDDYFNFKQGDEDTESYSYTLASPERNEILWLAQTQQLLIGTSGGEWVASGNDVDTSITPTSIQVRQHGSDGSIALRPILLEGRIAYMQRGGRKLRALQYEGAQERFDSEDLSILSDHLTAGGVTSMAYQAQRDSVVWATTGNGTLIGLTYEPDHQVNGWHRHETPGNFEWVETIYGSEDDEVWVIVQRQINGISRRYIENMRGYFNPTVDVAPDTEIQIAYCVDVTGSMGGKIESVIDQLQVLANDMEQRYDSAEFALVTFRDEDDTEVLSDFTDAQTIIALLEDITASDGGDSDENGYGAIVLAVEQLNWNTGLQQDNVVLVATNAGSHERGNTQQEAIDALKTIGSRLSYGPVNSTDYQDIVDEVGGSRLDDLSNLAEDFANDVALFGYSATNTERRFVDSSVSYSDVPATVFKGLDHLTGEKVQILADGAVQSPQTVVDGQITLTNAASVVHVGLQYEAIMQPMRIDIDSQFGVMQGKEKRVYEAVLRLMDTGSVRIKTDEENEWDYVRDLNNEPTFGEAAELFTGETLSYALTTQSATDPTFILSSELPLPFTLVAAILKYNLTGS